MKRETGRYVQTSVTGTEVAAFVPHPLPPSEPPLQLNDPLHTSLAKARRELSHLELAGQMVPSIEWFIYAFVRKEAVLSSQIEGTQATLVNLLEFEAQPAQRTLDADVEEVCNYLDALGFARDQLRRGDGLPLSRRLLDETHRRLLQGVRGTNKQPGEVRRSQNWIGGTRPENAHFVPPPPHLLGEALSDFEQYIHADDGLPPLIRIGLLHVQFETIHPYLDGNGRLGRLLIALLLEEWGLLTRPLLYLSLFFKQHRKEYYRRLDAVRTDGDWEGWLLFFLTGVAQVAREAVATSQDLFERINADRQALLSLDSATLMSVRLFELLPEHPVITSANATELLQTSRPTATKAIMALEEAEILVEVTGRQRDRIFHYKGYLDRLREGTEL